MTRDRRWYLIDVWRKRVDYPELKAAVQQPCLPTRSATRARRGRRRRDLARSRVARRGRLAFVAVKPDRDKISRMAVVSAKFEAGLVFFPERAPWLADFEAELFAFPGGRHDDQCDSVSQALTRRQLWVPDGDIARSGRRLQD